MALTDKDGNIIPGEAVGLMEYIRGKNNGTGIRSVEPGSSSQGSESIRGNVVGTIQSSTITGNGTPQSNNGTDETIRSRAYSAYGGTGTIESTQGRTTTGDSSANKSNQGLPGYNGNSRPNALTAAKNVIKPFSEIIKEGVKAANERGKAKPKKVEDKRLTDIEAIKLKPKVIDFIKWSSEHLDQFIQATTKGHAEVEIWSDLDTTDFEILADYWLARGKVSGSAARTIRNMSSFMERIKVYVILTPRMYKTGMTYFKRGISIR